MRHLKNDIRSYVERRCSRNNGLAGGLSWRRVYHYHYRHDAQQFQKSMMRKYDGFQMIGMLGLGILIGAGVMVLGFTVLWPLTLLWLQ